MGNSPRSVILGDFDEDGYLDLAAANSGFSVITVLLQCARNFVRGDDNGDGVVEVADPVYNLAYQFSSGPSLCLDSQDTNDDGAVDIADPVYNISHQFSLGPMPPAPFGACGVDPTADGLSCLGQPACP